MFQLLLQKRQMCGRFSLIVSEEELKKAFSVSGDIEVPTSYNIPPGQDIPAVRGPSDQSDERELVSLQWGLVPFWADEPDIGSNLINARAETVHEKPSFRDAYEKRRCIIPASGFYEWKSENGSKQPYYIKPKEDPLFGFAGLWESWTDEERDQELNSCTIITTSPNRIMKPIHNRMPVILPTSRYDPWLDPDQDPEHLSSFLTPCQSSQMDAYAISSEVNNPEYDNPSCIEPAG
jgi:putative SOS response-associated peptidase YedK